MPSGSMVKSLLMSKCPDMAPSTPAEPSGLQCIALTLASRGKKRCTRNAREGSPWCGRHGKEA
jgi:hypothetical protein